MRWHPHERRILVETLRGAGPDGPTLCAGWRARHLAAHVLLRERRPWSLAGQVLPAARDWTERRIAARAGLEPAWTDPAGEWDRLLADIAAGPGSWSPYEFAGEAVNLLEFFVHTEDVRRAAGDDTPRELPIGLQAGLWHYLTGGARLFLRPVPTGVVAIADTGLRRRLKSPPSGGRDGAPGTVVVRGEPGEIALWIYGRGAHARVDLAGSPDDVAAATAVLPVPA